jgi:hypothetical protein
MLDWKRFTTHAWTGYQQNQLDVIRPNVEPPVHHRQLHGQVFLLINFNAGSQRVTLPRAMRSLLDARETSAIDLPRYGVAVLLDSKVK